VAPFNATAWFQDLLITNWSHSLPAIIRWLIPLLYVQQKEHNRHPTDAAKNKEPTKEKSKESVRGFEQPKISAERHMERRMP